MTPPRLGTALLWVLLVVETSMSAELPVNSRQVIDFRDPAQAQGWTSVDDQVMGGVSASHYCATEWGCDPGLTKPEQEARKNANHPSGPPCRTVQGVAEARLAATRQSYP